MLTLAAAVRIAWILLCPNEPTSDQFVYHCAAVNLAHGHGFVDDSGNPNGWWPVGYSAALAPFYWLLGDSPRSGYVANLLFALALVAGVHALARRWFGTTVATIASLIAALHPTMVLLTTVLATENLFLPMAVWTTVLVATSVDEAGRVRWGAVASTGAAIGVSAYVRAPGLLLLAIVLLLLLLRRVGVRRAAAATALATATAFAVLLPWGLRTQHHFGTFQVVSMNGASNLWMGNHPGSDGGYHELPADVGGLPLREREAELGRRAKEFIRDHPLQYVQLCARRIATTLRSDTIAVAWNEKGLAARGVSGLNTPLRGLCTMAFHAVNALALLGLWWRRRSLGAGDVVLLAQCALAALPFILIVGGNRYHLPLAPWLWILAAAAAAWAIDRRAARWRAAGTGAVS